MKIKDYNEMIKHMTKNNNTPAENRIADLKQNIQNQKRMLKKRNDLGINTASLKESIIKAEQEIEDFKAPIKQDDPMTTWVKNNNANNKNPGTFKRLVEQDEKEYKQKLAKKTALDKVGENIVDALVTGEDLDPKEQVVTYDSATGLFSNKKKDNIIYEAVKRPPKNKPLKTICEACYSHKGINFRKHSMVKPLEKNSRLLKTKLEEIQIPKILNRFFRFNHHGELLDN